ncbi:MAG: T9SS type A sorting domain-containing protein, partial [Deltaproteobacteria bacterium]|nr:T9SS type A sorting domain-containing protein [Deltaproteobacteria bacterium]
DTEGLTTAWDFAGDPNDDSATNNYWSIDGSNNSGYPWLTWEGYSAATNSWDGSESTDFMDKDNWTLGIVPNTLNNITVSSGGNQPLIGASQSITINNLTVNSGASLIIDSDASNCGSLIVNGTSSGDVTYQLYLTGGTKWHLIVPPVSGQSINDFVTSGSNSIATNDDKYGLGYYNEETDTWTNFTTTTAPSAGNMVACTGFEVLRTSDGKVSITGTVPTSEKGTSIIKAANGWNLIGNPFPSAVCLNSNADGTNNFITYNTDVLDDAYVSIYLWNPASSQFEIVNHSSGATYIPPCQAFFVKSKDVEGAISFPITHRTHQTGAGFKSMESTTPEIILTAKSEEESFSTNIKYIEGTSLGLDPGYDAGMYAESASEIKLYSRLLESHDVKFGLQCLPDDNYENMIIPLGIELETDKELTITAQSMNIPEDLNIYLEDRENDSFIRLNNSEEALTIQLQAGNYENRFYLQTSIQFLGEDEIINTVDTEYHFIPNPDNSSIRIIGKVEKDAKLVLIDMTGKILFQTLLNNNNEISVPELKTGIYIVRLVNNKNSVSQKINWIL